MPKYDIRIETYGTVDELNSYLAVVAESVMPTSALYYEQIKKMMKQFSGMAKSKQGKRALGKMRLPF